MSIEQPSAAEVLDHVLRNVPLERRTTRLLISVMRRAGLSLGWAQHPSSGGAAGSSAGASGAPVECASCGRMGRLVTGVSPPRVLHPASSCGPAGLGRGRAS